MSACSRCPHIAVVLIVPPIFSVLTLKGAYTSGYVVLGATAVSTVALVMM